MITFTLPRLPPSTNGLFVEIDGKPQLEEISGKLSMVSKRKRIKTQPYKQWREEMGWEIKRQVKRKIVGEVYVRFEMVRSSGRSDLDNRIKALLDLIVEIGLIEDDSKVMWLSAAWVKHGPKCAVTIVPYPVGHDQAYRPAP